MPDVYGLDRTAAREIVAQAGFNPKLTVHNEVDYNECSEERLRLGAQAPNFVICGISPKPGTLLDAGALIFLRYLEPQAPASYDLEFRFELGRFERVSSSECQNVALNIRPGQGFRLAGPDGSVVSSTGIQSYGTISETSSRSQLMGFEPGTIVCGFDLRFVGIPELATYTILGPPTLEFPSGAPFPTITLNELKYNGFRYFGYIR